MRITATPLDVLRRVAQHYHARVSKCNLHDSNVARTPIDWREALSKAAPPPDRFLHETRFRDGDRRFTVRANDEFCTVQLRSEFGLTTVLSVNRPDVIVGANRPITAAMGERNHWTLFLPEGINVTDHRGLVQLVKRELTTFKLQATESLHLYGNGLTAYLYRPTIQRVIGAIASLVALSKALPAAPKDDSTLIVPDQFRGLASLARTWGITDDDERSKRLTRAGSSSLDRLVKAVTPQIAAISDWLDSFKDSPLTHGAIAMGALAECAIEAGILLKARQKGRERTR